LTAWGAAATPAIGRWHDLTTAPARFPLVYPTCFDCECRSLLLCGRTNDDYDLRVRGRKSRRAAVDVGPALSPPGVLRS